MVYDADIVLEVYTITNILFIPRELHIAITIGITRKKGLKCSINRGQWNVITLQR